MRNVMGTIMVASLLAVGATAQEQQPASPREPAATPSPQAKPQGEQPRRAEPAATQLTTTIISGCIQNAPPAAPAAGAAPAAAATSKFDLASAKTVTPAPVGTAGTTPVTRYRLEGDEKLLTSHLNHQVEITGTVAPASAAGAAAAPMLKVESVKMVAATCPSDAR